MIVAYLTDDPGMLSVATSSVSPHVRTGALMFNIPEDEITREDKENDGIKDPNQLLAWRIRNWSHLDFSTAPAGSTVRQGAKACNHSLNYGLQASAFAERNDIPKKEAARLINLYRGVAYPGIPAWHARIREEVEGCGYLTNCFERRRHFYGDYDISTWNKAFAFLPQSTVMDVTMEGMFCTQTLSEYTLRSQVHDSLIGTCPTDPETICRVSLAIVQAMSIPLTYSGHTFSLATDCKLGFSLNKKRMLSYDPSSIQSIEAALEKADKK